MYCNRKSLFSVATTVALMSLASTAQAATLNVPSTAYPTIQSALAGAAAGDTIVVAAGTYHESLYWYQKPLTLRGAGAGRTIIDAHYYYNDLAQRRCLFLDQVGADSRVEGFSFRNGDMFNGAGVWTQNSTLTIANCEFANNVAETSGGGLYNFGGAPTITNCSFRSNRADNLYFPNAPFFGGGGGLYNDHSNARVTNCLFTGNWARTGGGLCNSNSSPFISNCQFVNNATGANYSPMTASIGGGAMFNMYGRPTVTNCTFANNQGTAFAGGIFNISNDLILTNCSFRGNSGIAGGAIHNLATGNISVTNCIFWENSTNEGNPSIYGKSATVTNSLVQGLTNTSPDSNGNFAANPRFVEASVGDLRLLADSPARNRGTNAVVTPDRFPTVNGIFVDLNSSTRILDSIVNLGAYEQEVPAPIDITNRVSVTPYPMAAVSAPNTYQQIVTIRNTGNTTINGPIALIVGGLSRFTVSNANGVTSALAPAGRPYINLPINLPRGGTYALLLQFSRTASGTGNLNWTAQVVTGQGR